MYNLMFINPLIIAISLFNQLEAQIDDLKATNSIDKLYQELTPKDRLFISTSHIINQALLKKIDSISQKPNQKKHLILFLRMTN